MNVFQTHSRIVNDYAAYIRSFLSACFKSIKNSYELE
jgi:hypothetical protein